MPRRGEARRGEDAEGSHPGALHASLHRLHGQSRSGWLWEWARGILRGLGDTSLGAWRYLGGFPTCVAAWGGRDTHHDGFGRLLC